MATIKVNSKVMREKATSFLSISSSVEKMLGEITTEIDGLKKSWEGTASETYALKYKKFAEGFDEICKSIKDYGEFLNLAAERYEEREKANTQKAEGQKS